jgi:hypothetical protein
LPDDGNRASEISGDSEGKFEAKSGNYPAICSDVRCGASGELKTDI